jgi:hypothetical protein
VKAQIWKDRETGRWHWDVRGHGLRAAGERAAWDGALVAALDELRWIGEHQHAWPGSLLALGWR